MNQLLQHGHQCRRALELLYFLECAWLSLLQRLGGLAIQFAKSCGSVFIALSNSCRVNLSLFNKFRWLPSITIEMIQGVIIGPECVLSARFIKQLLAFFI